MLSLAPTWEESKVGSCHGEALLPTYEALCQDDLMVLLSLSSVLLVTFQSLLTSQGC